MTHTPLDVDDPRLDALEMVDPELASEIEDMTDPVVRERALRSAMDASGPDPLFEEAGIQSWLAASATTLVPTGDELFDL